MSEILNIPKLLDKFSDEGLSLSVIERMILANDGTVQTLLSVVFDKPVTVRVNEQRQTVETIQRTADLMAGDTVACSASTVIPRAGNSPAVLKLVLEEKRGLGQIAAVLGIHTTRSIDEIGAGEESFWRYYTLAGTGPGERRLTFRICESFPRNIYRFESEAVKTLLKLADTWEPPVGAVTLDTHDHVRGQYAGQQRCARELRALAGEALR